MTKTQEREDGIIEETKKAFTEDADAPMDKKAPGSTFAIVALSYPVLLAIVALTIALIFWLVNVLSTPELTVESAVGMVPGWFFR